MDKLMLRLKVFLPRNSRDYWVALIQPLKHATTVKHATTATADKTGMTAAATVRSINIGSGSGIKNNTATAAAAAAANNNNNNNNNAVRDMGTVGSHVQSGTKRGFEGERPSARPSNRGVRP